MKAIRTKYVGPTNTKGARIIAGDEDGNRITISYPHELSGEAVHRAAAEALCQKMKWTGNLAGGSLKNCYVFVFTETLSLQSKPSHLRYTISTQSLGDGSEACYVVYYNREIVAIFPINDPSSPDAREYAERFAATMDTYVGQAVDRLAKQ